MVGVMQSAKNRTQKRPRASDALVDEIRTLHEDCGWSYRRLAQRYGFPRSTVSDWCLYRRR